MTIFDVWNFPLKCDNKAAFGIFDQQEHLVFNFCCDLSDKNKKKILDRVNGLECPNFDLKPYFHDDKYLYYNSESGPQRVLLMRSWGYLTGIGGLHLNAQEAFELQKQMLSYVTNKMNGNESICS